jgi:uncharacterized protein Usg
LQIRRRRETLAGARRGNGRRNIVGSVEFRKQLAGYGLTTANILYGMPDHPRVLQTYVWQGYDLAPVFPELRHFLDFWVRELEGPLHSVRVAHKKLISAAECRMVTAELRLQ